MAQYVAHAEEAWLLVTDYAAVGRYVALAVGKGVERVDSLVAGGIGYEVYEDRGLGCCVVFYLAYFYLATLVCLED